MGRIFAMAGRHFWQDDCRRHAAALTYTTLFAVVPLLTVVFSLLAIFPATQGLTESVQSFVFSNLVPSSSAVVADHLQSFSQQAGQLTLVGVAVLVVTVILLLVAIEEAFNDLWQVKPPRQNLYSILRYWAIITLGPFLLGASFVVSSYLTSLRLLSDADALMGSVVPGLALVPLIFTAVGFSLLYILVPNCRVSVRAGIFAGVVAALLFELAKRGFTLFITQFASYELIYGAFAAFPVFLLWLFVSWLIILFGVELTRSATLQEQGPVTPQHPLLVLMTVLQHLHRAHQEGRGIEEVTLIRLTQPAVQWPWSQWKAWLAEERLMQRDAQGLFRLGRDLHHWSLADLLQRLPWAPPTAAEVRAAAAAPWTEPLAHWLTPWSETLESTTAPALSDLMTRS